MTKKSPLPSERARRRHYLEEGAPSSPFSLRGAAVRHAFLRVYRGFFDHVVIDLAAGLTYWSLISLLPLLVAMVSVLGVIGRAEDTITAVSTLLSTVVPTGLLVYIEVPVRQVVAFPSAHVLLVASVVLSLVTASVWVMAFSRAINRIYEVPEMRSAFLLRPQMILVTLMLVALLVAAALIFVASPDAIAWVAELVGMQAAVPRVWAVVRWPLVLLMALTALVVLLYSTPNVRQPGFRWTWPGAAFTLFAAGGALWLLSHWLEFFGDDSFNRTYGALATPFIGVVCMFLVNLSLILGVELNAGIERARELQTGVDAVGRLQLPPVSRRQAPRLARIRASDAEKARSLMVTRGHSSTWRPVREGHPKTRRWRPALKRWRPTGKDNG